jgi:alpha-1,3-rhamnosyl/mannosyltransferase
MSLYDLTALLFPETMSRQNLASSRLLLREAARSADTVVAVSRATASLAKKLLQVAPSKLRVIYSACGVAIAPMTRTRAEEVVQTRYGLKSGYLLTVGTLEPRKDHMTLLRALDALGPTAPPLVVVGASGWRSRTIREAIRMHERARRVLYVGWTEDQHLTALYCAARLTVYPSLYEGFGLPVLEAMACGCPVLCSWSSSLPEVGGEAARYFRPGDADDLARHVRELLVDDGVLDEMRGRGAKQAAEFSFQTAAEQMFAALHETSHS